MSLNVDLLLTGGKIHTGTKSTAPVEAIAVKNGRIFAVGKTDELGGVNAKTRINLEGKTLIPGLIDAHNHLSYYSMLLRLLDCRTPLHGEVAELLEKIQREVKQSEPGKLIRGWGFAEYKIRDRRYPTLAEMDEAAPNNPVIITHASGHSAVTNSLMLKQMKIDSQTPDPKGGKIERDPQTNEPTGVLHDAAMFQYSLEALIMEFGALSLEERIVVLEQGAEDYARLGITTVGDPGTLPSQLSAYQEAARSKRLKCRVSAFPFYEMSKPFLDSGLRTGFGTDMFKIGPIKLIGDGSLSGRTAAVSQPYQNTDSLGLLYRDQEALDKIVAELDALGQQIAIHAIGDRAVEQVLLAYEKVIGKGNPNTRRHRMEHAGIVNPQLLQLMKGIDLVIATQPRMLYEQGDGFYRSCGEERIHSVYPYKTYIEMGLHVAGSSDCPVTNPNPLLGMRDGILRQTEEGLTLAPEQKLSVEQVFHMFTWDAAYSLFDENDKGTLEEGKFADMLVLSEDPFTLPAEKWESQLKVEKTIVGGEVVYSKD
ncbi:MAG: amidohydrolase [Anaerolineales bacterium]|nr:amidohydrolase [Anaerolineales bacterium]